MTKKEKQECSGYYEVSGYTTGSGKKVDSYTRHCWKHSGGASGRVTNSLNEGENPNTDNTDNTDVIYQKENPTEDPVPTEQPAPQPTSQPVPEDKTDWKKVWGGLFQTAMQLYFDSLNSNNGNNVINNINYNYSMPNNTLLNSNTNYKNFEFSKFDPKMTKSDIQNSMKNIEEILNRKIITKEDIAKVSNQTQTVMHNLFDDIEDLSVLKSNLPEIPTVESSKESQKIENDRKQIRENAYQTILMLYQQRNVVEKQWKKVSTKDEDYDNKFNQYIENKQEIEKLSNTAKTLFDYASKIDDATLEKVKKLRDEIGLMRFRPMPSKKQVKQQQKWIWPCNGSIVGEYGEQRSDHVHNGIDIKVPVGTPVKAIADGIVVAASSADGYGKFVVIEHSLNGQIITSEYGHISRWVVSKNQIVKQGQIIAYSGNEGYSFGPHVHLTIRIGKYRGKAVNPWNYINR